MNCSQNSCPKKTGSSSPAPFVSIAAFVYIMLSADLLPLLGLHLPLLPAMAYVKIGSATLAAFCCPVSLQPTGCSSLSGINRQTDSEINGGRSFPQIHTPKNARGKTGPGYSGTGQKDTTGTCPFQGSARQSGHMRPVRDRRLHGGAPRTGPARTR